MQHDGSPHHQLHLMAHVSQRGCTYGWVYVARGGEQVPCDKLPDPSGRSSNTVRTAHTLTDEDVLFCSVCTEPSHTHTQERCRA